jgi:hypothetical protein
MDDTITLQGEGYHSVLATHPVTRESYKQFLHDTKRAVPHALAQPEPGSRPVTYVSQVDALAYCHWQGKRDGRAYRLPAVCELQELADELGQQGATSDLWAHEHGERPEVIGGLKPVWLCEWTQETEVIEQAGDRAPRALGSIFYPPWLREGNTPGHAQAHLAADQGYSFVTFRLVYDPQGTGRVCQPGADLLGTGDIENAAAKPGTT